MIDNYLLEELVAFAQEKTLAKAADKLGLSQPAITRGTKKLESELNLKLFTREPNKIYLNETGKFAAKKAKQVLALNNFFVSEVKKFDQSNHEITITTVAPGPFIVLDHFKYPGVKTASTFLKNNEDPAKLLLNGQYTCVITNQAIAQKSINSIFLGRERLIVHLNKFSNLASHSSVTFKELAGLSFIVVNQIGIWSDLIQKEIPNAHFLYQERNNFNEIRNNSIFPYFTSNLTNNDPAWNEQISGDRIPITISDSSATMSFYINFLSKNKKRLTPLIEQWQDAWSQFDA